MCSGSSGRVDRATARSTRRVREARTKASASGLINPAEQVCGALGLAVLATVVTSRTDCLLRAAHGAHSALPGALTDGFSRAS